MTTKTCKERINGELKDRISDLRQLWEAYCNPDTATSTEDGNIIGGDMDGAHVYEYGLGFDHVAPEAGSAVTSAINFPVAARPTNSASMPRAAATSGTLTGSNTFSWTGSTARSARFRARTMI